MKITPETFIDLIHLIQNIDEGDLEIINTKPEFIDTIELTKEYITDNDMVKSKFKLKLL